jgi:hypothetical protein
VQALLTDWIAAESRIIGEWSGEIEADTMKLLAQAQERADVLGIAWGLWLVPESINDQVDRWAEWRAAEA